MYTILKNYGENRSLEPEGAFPAIAWKLDTSLPISKNEMLINVDTINISVACFNQLKKETYNNPVGVAKKIMSIVKMRGKFHNPVTGTGGTLCGSVMEIGSAHPAYNKLNEGDKIATLISTKFTPLVIRSIKKINMRTGQIDIDGYAILSEKCMYSIIPDDIPSNIYLAFVNEAGQCYKANLNCKKNITTLVIGAATNTGLISLFGIREKIGIEGKLIAIADNQTQADVIMCLGIVDECYVLDIHDPLTAYYKLISLFNNQFIDYTIDCESIQFHEVLSILITRENGTVYFTDPAISVSEAGLIAEGIGKDINLVYYHGYIEGHVDFCINLFRKYEALKAVFFQKYTSNNDLYATSDADTSNSTVYKNIVINSPAMKEIGNIVQHIAPYDTTVLITGSSGCGKEVIANLIQELSARKSHKFIKINCAAISDSLFESEFFGYESGAFTGALKGGKAGYFESANNGTLFLDEIGELSLENQVKLLRVLQSSEVIRVGGSSAIKVNVRIIAATNKNLFEMVNQGTFREDLYYRLNVINIYLPALKNRREDIRPFIEHFIDVYNKQFNMNKTFSEKAMELLSEYDWPGNVRELENMVQRLMLYTQSRNISELDIQNICPSVKKQLIDADKDNYLNLSKESAQAVMSDEESAYREAALHCKTTRQMAEYLNTSQPTVVRRLKKYNIKL